MARKIEAPSSDGRSKREDTSTRGGRQGGGRRVPLAPVAKRTAGGGFSRGGAAAPARRQSPNPIMPQQYSVGGPSAPLMGGGGPQIAPAVSAPSVISEEDYLAGDSAYQAQVAALKGALERYQADVGLQRTNYANDYNSGLRDLGYDEANKAWNWDDTLTASGRAYQNQLNDFASRGMLQSQGFADSNNDLQRMLGQQYDQMATNKTNFLTELDRGLANFQGENVSSQQAARAEAIARRAAQYGI